MIEEIKQIIKKERIKFLNLQFTEIFGTLKNVIISLDKFDDVAKYGLWFDGSSIEGFARIYESDMLLRPDWATFAVLPWSPTERRAGRVICDIFTPSGEPFSGDPRGRLKMFLKKIKEKDLLYYTGAELEFYLFERDKMPVLIPHDRKSYFDYTPLSRATEVCEKTMEALRNFGIKGEMHHHEVVQGQHEIDVAYDNALKTADNIITIKTALKALTGNQSGLKVTWMPKYKCGMAGNGMHVHQSIFRGDRNLFYQDGGQYNLSRAAKYFIAGQLEHAKAITALTNPTVNSYKRLVHGYEAPVYICWGQTNRSALIRIPRGSQGKEPVATRLEYRSPDSSANPYLAFTVMLAAGLDGWNKREEPANPVEEDVYDLDELELKKYQVSTLPDTLIKAVDYLESDKVILDAIGEKVSSVFIAAKKKEWREFLQQV